MVRLLPVDHDPFGQPSMPALGPQSRYIQVDHDPFSSGAVGGLGSNASPVDFAAQSMMASGSAQPASPLPPERQMFADIRATANRQMMEPPAPAEPPRFGDSLKSTEVAGYPVLGGHNPIAETFDRVIMPFLPGAPDTQDPQEQAWLDQRGVGERAADTAAFAASAPVRMLTRGQYGAGDIASGLGFPQTGQSIAAGEQDFARANQDQLGAAQLLGEAALGVTGASLSPMMARNPPRPVVEGAPSAPVQPGALPVRQPGAPGALPPPQPGATLTAQPGPPVGPGTQTMSMPSSATARARQYVRDLDELGMPRFGPAIAQAAREGEGMGVMTRMIQNVPLAGRPIERGGVEFYNSAARVADDLANRFSETTNPESAGKVGQSYLERFRDKRTIDKEDISSLPDAEIARLATTPPREIGSFKTAADARYEQAWRNIPEMYRDGRSFIEEPRLMGDMPLTRRVILKHTDRNLKMMNRQRQERMAVGDETPDVLPTRFKEIGSIPKAAIPVRGGVLGTAMEDILAGNWKGSLQTMRNIETQLRLADVRKADTEGNAIDKGMLRELRKSVARDASNLMDRIARTYRTDGEFEMAQRYEAAKRGLDQADAFYRRYSEAMETVMDITKADRDIDVITRIVNAANGGAKANSDKLLQIRRIAPPEVLDTLAAGVLNFIGRPTGRAGAGAQEAGFSLSKAVSQWNAMSPRGRQLIWGHRPQLYQQLNKFFKIAEGMAEYEKMINTSKSGQHVIAALTAAGGLAALSSMTGMTKALMIGAGAYGAARWLTSPAYVAWLTKSLQIQKQAMSGKMTPQAAQAAAARHSRSLSALLRKDMSIDPATKQAILSGATGAARAAPRVTGAASGAMNESRNDMMQ